MYREANGREAMGYFATKPTAIITTLHDSGIVNAGVFGAYTNLSPSQIGVATSVKSDTYNNILSRGEYVINIPGAELAGKLRILASRIPPSKSEVEEAGLSLKEGLGLSTPSIAECVAAGEFRFEREVEVGQHSFMIGRCEGGWIKERYLDKDGKIDIFKAKVIKDFKYPAPLYVLPGEVVEG